MPGIIVEQKWLKRILAVEAKFAKAETFVTSILMVVAIFFLIVQVASRFIFHIPIPWSEEIIRYSFVAFVFIGAAVATHGNRNIEIDLLMAGFDKIKNESKRRKFIKYSNIFRYLIVLLTCIFLSVLCLSFTAKIYKMQQSTPAMEIPMWIIDFAIFLGLFFTALHSLIKMITELTDNSTTKQENEL